MQCDRRPDGRFGVGVGKWNVGGMSEMGGEVCEEMGKRMIDDDVVCRR